MNDVQTVFQRLSNRARVFADELVSGFLLVLGIAVGRPGAEDYGQIVAD